MVRSPLRVGLKRWASCRVSFMGGAQEEWELQGLSSDAKEGLGGATLHLAPEGASRGEALRSSYGACKTCSQVLAKSSPPQLGAVVQEPMLDSVARGLRSRSVKYDLFSNASSAQDAWYAGDFTGDAPGNKSAVTTSWSQLGVRRMSGVSLGQNMAHLCEMVAMISVEQVVWVAPTTRTCGSQFRVKVLSIALLSLRVQLANQGKLYISRSIKGAEHPLTFSTYAW